jgi:hypothetical protein
MHYANLQIGLYLWDRDRYAINVTFSQSGSDADVREEVVGLALNQFDRKQFLECFDDLEEYGKRLGRCILTEPRVRDVFQNARTVAQKLDAAHGHVPLRVQLVLSPKMPDLHDLRWELLRDPVDGKPLFVRDDILFSRYQYSEDTRPVLLREEGNLRALAVIANPNDLHLFRGMAPIDLERETERLQYLEGIEVTKLAAPERATLNEIVTHLQDPQGYDILYLVCHGALVEGEPRLWLEKPSGESAIVSGSTLAERLGALATRPRLVMLVSCESAGTGQTPAPKDEGALAAVGPRLARGGIAAVVAMQGKVSMQTISEFLPAFFRSLHQDGQIDLAMARGRAAVQDAHDCWMPVLFMRSNTGRLWAEPGLHGAPGAGFDAWDSLMRHIEAGQCTPLIGAGVNEDLFGGSRQIARRWADLFHYPLDPRERESLPQVAQFLATTTSSVSSKNELVAYLHRELLDRFGHRLLGLKRDGRLDELVEEAGRWRRQNTAAEPHKVLASLRCPLYVTTNPDSLLVAALKENGVAPEERAFDWLNPSPPPDPLFREGSDYWPSPERPLIYHLFGSLQKNPITHKPDLRSLVLSEDDYFQYLVAMTRNKASIPLAVNEALTNSALLFVGFELNDWSFRILMQSICEREGSVALDGYSHVAVQLDPREGLIPDPDKARRYLEKLGRIHMRQLSIFWGSVSDFLGQLQKKLEERAHPTSPLEEAVR